MAAFSGVHCVANLTCANANSLGDFARALIRSFNEEICFDRTNDYRARKHACAGRGIYSSFVTRYRKFAPASASTHRDSEGVATASERSTSCHRQNEWKHDFVIA